MRLGRGEVVDIERQVELGGPIHSKGVLILAGFLGARYAEDQPLSLSATLVFEQSYGGVEGDSASSAELYALLSALADLPVKQCFAVTGSVNQHGEIQVIGGVNEKIEGFFDICAKRGLERAAGRADSRRQCAASDAAAGRGRCRPHRQVPHLSGVADRRGDRAADGRDGRRAAARRQVPEGHRQQAGRGSVCSAWRSSGGASA